MKPKYFFYFLVSRYLHNTFQCQDQMGITVYRKAQDVIQEGEEGCNSGVQ